MTGPGMSEADLQQCIIEAAQLLGWRVAHFRAAQRKDGQWRTPVEADGAGFPDLVLVRDDRLIFAELKSARGKLSDAQTAWLEALDLAAWDVEVYVWRPEDWLSDRILRILRDGDWLNSVREGAAVT